MQKTKTNTTTDLHEAVTQLTGTLSELTGNTFYVKPLKLEDLPDPVEAFEKTCKSIHTVHENHLSYDSRFAEEEDEEEIGYISSDLIESASLDTWAFADEQELEGISGKEQVLAKLQLKKESETDDDGGVEIL